MFFIEQSYSRPRLTQSKRLGEELDEFAGQASVSGPVIRSIAQSWLTLFKAAQKLQLSPEHVLADLVQLGVAQERATFVAKAYRKHTPAFQRTVVGASWWRELAWH